MSESAICLVCSGESACLVSGTSSPWTRARKTSPALMCRSDAPRSTAALMIFSMESVSSLFIDHVSQRLSSGVSAPVVEKEIQLPRPKPAWRNWGDVRGEKDLPELPQVTGRCEWLLAKDVETRAAQPTIFQPGSERLLIDQSPASHVHHNRRPREQIEALGREQAIRFGGLGRRQDDDVVVRQLCVQVVEADRALEPCRRTQPYATPDASAPRAEGRQSFSNRPADPADADDQRTDAIHLTQYRVYRHERRLVPFDSPLLVERDVQSSQKVQHSGDDILGDRNRVDAGRVRERDVALHHFAIKRRAHPGSRRVCPSKPLSFKEEEPRNAEAVILLSAADRRHHLVARPWGAVAIRARLGFDDADCPALGCPGSDPPFAFGCERPIRRTCGEIDDEQALAGTVSLRGHSARLLATADDRRSSRIGWPDLPGEARTSGRRRDRTS